jgi:hypothetical protein
VMRLEVIGQRLLTGRLCIAQAALVFARTLFARTAAYAREKPVWAPVGAPRLIDMPQLRAVFARADAGLGEIERFVGVSAQRRLPTAEQFVGVGPRWRPGGRTGELRYARGGGGGGGWQVVERQLCACLRDATIPDDALVEAIAVSESALALGLQHGAENTSHQPCHRPCQRSRHPRRCLLLLLLLLLPLLLPLPLLLLLLLLLLLTHRAIWCVLGRCARSGAWARRFTTASSCSRRWAPSRCSRARASSRWTCCCAASSPVSRLAGWLAGCRLPLAFCLWLARRCGVWLGSLPTVWHVSRFRAK